VSNPESRIPRFRVPNTESRESSFLWHNHSVAPPRIEELQRRVDEDPASTAFADLAEEYRSGGNLHGAVRVAREGLAHHPDLVPARMTLARALVELGELDAAQAEFESVIHAAPDNLTAHFGLEDVQRRRGKVAAADPAVDPVMLEFQKALEVLDQVTIPEAPDVELDGPTRAVPRAAAAAAAPAARVPDMTPIDGSAAAEPANLADAALDAPSQEQTAASLDAKDDFEAVLRSLRDKPGDGRGPAT
jgi:tetratricopeptide (TPR) repeat protein